MSNPILSMTFHVFCCGSEREMLRGVSSAGFCQGCICAAGIKAGPIFLQNFSSSWPYSLKEKILLWMRHLIQTYILLGVPEAQTQPPRGRQRRVQELEPGADPPAPPRSVGLRTGTQRHPGHPPGSQEHSHTRTGT